MNWTMNPSISPQTSNPPTNGLKILMADDLDENIYLVRLFLGREFHHVTGVPNGREAVKQFQKEAFDIILMDVNMPVMDGLEATKKIRALEQEQEISRPIPIIAFTASDSKEDQKSFQNAGMDGIIVKPIDFKTLSDLINSLAKKNISASDNGEIAAKSTASVSPSLKPVSTEPSKWDIDGVHMKKAMENWGSAQFFKERLHLFHQRYHNTATIIAQCLDSENLTDLKTVTHSLKGLAGNLSLTKLYPLFIKLDDAAGHNDLNRITALLPSLQEALDAIPDYIEALGGIEDSHSRKDQNNQREEASQEISSSGLFTDDLSSDAASIDSPEISHLLLELKASFDQYSPDACAPFMKKLGKHMKRITQLDPIAEAIDRFDFEAAKKETEQLIEMMNKDVDL